MAPLTFLNREILTWNDKIVIKLVLQSQKYRGNDAYLFSTHLAMLADAMEEAGCEETEITNHLRQTHDPNRECYILQFIIQHAMKVGLITPEEVYTTAPGFYLCPAAMEHEKRENRCGRKILEFLKTI